MASAPTEAVIARLLEERLWCANEDQDQYDAAARAAASKNANVVYLQQNVFPTLVPALARMLELAQTELEEGRTEVRVPVKGESKKPVPDFGPTGVAHPITWLAEYLMRNHPQFNGNAHLVHHPYVLVEQGKKAQESAKHI